MKTSPVPRTREPSFRELTASTEKRRGGPFLRTPSRSSSRWHTQHAALGSFQATRLAARENAAVFCGRVIHHAGDITIVENAGTFLLWYDTRQTFPFDKCPAATLI